MICNSIIYVLCTKSFQSCPTLCDPMDYIPCQAPLSMEFSRQEYWSGLPCLLPGDLPDLGIQPMSLRAHALQADSLALAPPGKPLYYYLYICTSSGYVSKEMKTVILKEYASQCSLQHCLE